MFYFQKVMFALVALGLFLLGACTASTPTPSPVSTPLREPTNTIPSQTATAIQPTNQPTTEPVGTSTITSIPRTVAPTTETKPPQTATVALTQAPAIAEYTWTKLAEASSAGSAVPPARFDHALAFDSDKQQLVLFGGRANGQPFGDTWIYDLGTKQWREIKSQGPSARFGFASVYDSKSKAVYLFGGQKESFYNDTWKFDTVNETWSEVQTEGEKPGIRYGHGVTLDTQTDRLIISHGFARDGRHNDTWALDLNSKQWTELTPPGDKPLNRCLHDIAYAPASNAVYLFGGCSSGFGPCPQGDLWSLDLSTNQWTMASPAGQTPSPRENPAIVVDDKTGNLILFGGRAGSPTNDLWVFDRNDQAWTQIAAQGPSERKSHDAVYDSVNNRVYLFGGNTNTGAVNDLWVLEF